MRRGGVAEDHNVRVPWSPLGLTFFLRHSLLDIRLFAWPHSRVPHRCTTMSRL